MSQAGNTGKEQRRKGLMKRTDLAICYRSELDLWIECFLNRSFDIKRPNKKVTKWNYIFKQILPSSKETPRSITYLFRNTTT